LVAGREGASGGSLAGSGRRHIGGRAATWPDATELFVWRREARIKSIPAATEPLFVPAIAGREEDGAAESPTRLETTRPHTIELDVAGSSVFIWAGADPTLVVTIIGALKAAK
jgi:hypothetical protein